MAAKGLHQELYMHRLGNLVRIQPVGDGAEDAPALTIELKSCQLGLSSASIPLSSERGAQRIWGVIGLQTLLEGSALAVVTGAKQVAELQGHAVYAVTGTQVFHNEDGGTDDDRYAELLRAAVNPAAAGKGLFFSYGADLTLSQQQWARVAGGSGAAAPQALHARADARFFFNRQVVRALLDAGAKLPGVERFALPLIMGSVQQLRSVALGPDAVASVTLIARRSVQRPGTRHWRRGADAEGVVANFVETEQLVNLQTPQGKSVSSFVQVRGSIPLLWSQVPNIRYKPTTRLAPPDASRPAFDAHFTGLLEAYKEVVAVNLANQHGSEGVLSSAYEDNAARFAGKAEGLRLVPFDFHKQCGATRYDRLALLWGEVRPDFERFGFYAEGPAGSNRQAGVFRINCIDCLDRTNVVQGVLARHHLEYLLRSLGLMTDSGSLPSKFPKVEAQFKVIWANHGDDISLQYAGTGALKSGFTRTGVRTRAGMLDDGVKSGLRYYRNNFTDGVKQDALDLVTGAYVISKDKPSPFTGKIAHHPNPILQVLVVITGALLGLSHLQAMVMGRAEATPVLLLQRVLVPFAISAGLVCYVAKNGKRMVNRPLLRPDLTQPWS